MRRLCIVLLQDLAVLQLRFPSLPFFIYAPFHGQEWEDFAHTVQAGVADATEPPSLLLQRALPELCGLIESTRNAILHSSQQLAGQLASQLASQESKFLDTLLSGKIPITITGYLGAGPSLVLGVPAAAPAAAPAVAAALTPVSQPAAPPIITSLAKVYTVEDAWRK
jgi:hypothetical protein